MFVSPTWYENYWYSLKRPSARPRVMSRAWHWFTGALASAVHAVSTRAVDLFGHAEDADGDLAYRLPPL